MAITRKRAENILKRTGRRGNKTKQAGNNRTTQNKTGEGKMKKIKLGLTIVAAVTVAGAVYASSVSSYAVPKLVEEINTVITSVEGRLDGIEGGTTLPLLASGKIIVGNSGGTGEARTVTGDITLSNAGVAAIVAGVIVDADINASAGIVSTKLSSAVQTSLGKADSAYQKPGTGIPSTDMSAAVVTSLGKADTAVQTEVDPVAVPAINLLIDYLSDGLLADGGLAEGTTPQKFKTTTTAIWTVGGVAKAKVAEDEIEFSTAFVINAVDATNAGFGIVLVQVNASGVVSTKVPADPQAYASAALALAELPAVDVSNVALGYIAIEVDADNVFTAKTTSLSDANVTATYVDGDIKTLPSKL